MKFRNRQPLVGKDEAAWLDGWAARNAPKEAPADLEEAAAKLAEKAESDAGAANISLKMALKYKGYAQTVHYMCDLLEDAAE